MKGHETIIQMRNAGKMPGFVFVNDFPCSTRWAEWNEYATVCTADDKDYEFDMRFTQGLSVSISGTSQRRAKILFDACKKAGAKSVAVCVVQPDNHQLDQSGWTEIYHAS